MATNTSQRRGESQQQWAVNGSNGDQHIASAVGCIGDRGMAATATNTSHRLWAATVIEESRRRIAAVGGLRISAAGIEWVV